VELEKIVDAIEVIRDPSICERWTGRHRVLRDGPGALKYMTTALNIVAESGWVPVTLSGDGVTVLFALLYNQNYKRKQPPEHFDDIPF
jgi:hypothetical protein